MASQEFYYLITDLHNLATQESMYALENQEMKPDESLLDNKILGANEADFFKRLLKSAGAAMYKRIHRRGREVTNAYQFDAEYDSTPGYIIFTLDFPDNFDTNLYDTIDSLIQDALINHVLAAWFKRTRQDHLANEFELQYNNSIDQVKSSIEMRTYIKRPSTFWGPYYIDEETT